MHMGELKRISDLWGRYLDKYEMKNYYEDVFKEISQDFPVTLKMTFEEKMEYIMNFEQSPQDIEMIKHKIWVHAKRAFMKRKGRL